LGTFKIKTMGIITGILVMYILAVAIGTGLCKWTMPEDRVKKHLKVMIILFGITFVGIGALINMAVNFI
jgi:hypothetical protein